MLIRIVKMTFRTEKIDEFLDIFDSSKEKIRAFEGCHHLKLLRDVNSPNIFFTYSHWESEEDLNNYRKSEFFISTWAKTKTLFAEKAVVNSLFSISEQCGKTSSITI